MDDATLSELQEMMLRFRDERDWKQFHNPKDMAIGLCLEAAELLELMHWKQGEALQEQIDHRRGEIADELADLLGWVLLMANDFGVDLAASYKEKMIKNAEKYPVEKARGSSRKYNEL